MQILICDPRDCGPTDGNLALGGSETGAERLGKRHLTVRCTSSVLSDEFD